MKYIFKPYSDVFADWFLEEKNRIQAILKQAIIEHIGSTAVMGLGGKGILDIALGVDTKSIITAKELLVQLGYSFFENHSTENRLFFKTTIADMHNSIRIYHIHLLPFNCDEWKDLLFFRDYLRNNYQAMINYATVKKEAVLKADNNGEKYRSYKAEFIENVLQKREIP